MSIRRTHRTTRRGGGLFATGMPVALALALLSPAVMGQGVIYVDSAATGAGNGTSWHSAFVDLQSALDAAHAGDEIWVAAGTYVPTRRSDPGNLRTAWFTLVDGVAMYGGFAGGEAHRDQRDWNVNETILSGDLFGDDGPDFTNNVENCHHVVVGDDTGPGTILDGFIITGGNATGTMVNAWTHGGGMSNIDGSPTVMHCVFIENMAFLGGGVWNRGDLSSPTFTDCWFIGNDVSGTIGDGGGLYNNEGATSALVGCRFIENRSGDSGGGLMHLSRTPIAVVNCSFEGNFVGGTGLFGAGAGVYLYAESVLVNCAFAGNRAIGFVGGGGLYMEPRGQVFIANSTYASNWATLGGGIYNYNLDDAPEVHNCILWGNLAGDGTVQDESAQIDEYDGISSIGPVLNYCDVQGWTGTFGGTGNFGADPLFVRPPDDGGDGWGVGDNDDYGDLSLLPGSPCIDAGDSLAVPEDVGDVDTDGNLGEKTPLDLGLGPRFVDDPGTPDTGQPDPANGVVVDIGAHEYPNGCPDGQACSDGDPCTINDVCSSGQCRGTLAAGCAECYSDAQCNDGIACTSDACINGQCVFTPDSTYCDDGLFCNGAEMCDTTSGCVAGLDPCGPDESCDEVGDLCGECADDADCADSVACTVETCVAGACVSVPDDANCPDDGVFCNGPEECHPALGCVSAGNPCGPGILCNELSDECDYCLTDEDCDDGVGCTDDVCVNGSCSSVRNDENCADDGLFCNGSEVCDPLAGCVSVGEPCRPGTRCDEDRDTCGECADDGHCNDGLTCTVDSCDQGQCVFVPDDSRCPDDGRFCNGQEFCDPAGGCRSTGNPCPPALVCDEFYDLCADCATDDECSDGDPCTIDACVNGGCIHGPDPDCDESTTSIALDFDNDGVPDPQDVCPDTPAGAPVDAQGCPLNSADRPADAVVPETEQPAGPAPSRSAGTGGASFQPGSLCGAVGMVNLSGILLGLFVMSGLTRWIGRREH